MENKHTYGIETLSFGYIDISNSLRGAKNFATRHGYTSVFIRYNNGYVINKVAEKVNNKWVNLS